MASESPALFLVYYLIPLLIHADEGLVNVDRSMMKQLDNAQKIHEVMESTKQWQSAVKHMDSTVKQFELTLKAIKQMNDQRKEMIGIQDTIIRHLNISHLTIPIKEID